jgi:exopolyphosphatase/guanosine-5'-triphosphate,3'-diphosphate pyrophosphatase
MEKQPGIERIALIDIGSNTVRLVIFNIDTNAYYEIDELQNIKVSARLVQYVENGKMNAKGIHILTNLIANYLKIVEEYDIDRLIPVATAAVRNSSNVDEIVNHVYEHTGLKMRILSDKEEAYYGNYAIRYTFNIYDGVSVDIGGGSTEVTMFKNKEIVHSHSFPFGAVSLTNQFFEGKEHSDEEAIKETRKWVKNQLKKVDWLAKTNLPIIGIGGSARNIAEVYQLQNDYPIAGMHGYPMKPEWVDETLDIFTSRSYKELDSLDGLSQDRKDTIVSATIVFQQLLKTMKSPSFILSRRGLREGIIIDFLNEHNNEPYSLYSVPQQTVIRMSSQYNVQEISTNQRITIADMLLIELEKNNILSVDIDHMEMMYYGATLYMLGSFIENDSRSQHTFYVISNTNIHGFDHFDRARLALLASYKNRSLYKQYLGVLEGWFTEDEKSLLLKLGSIIKFSEALNDSHVNTIEDISLVESKDEGYDLIVSYSGEIVSEKYQAEKQRNHFERAVGDHVNIKFQVVNNDKK